MREPLVFHCQSCHQIEVKPLHSVMNYSVYIVYPAKESTN